MDIECNFEIKHIRLYQFLIFIKRWNNALKSLNVKTWNFSFAWKYNAFNGNTFVNKK